MNEHSQNGGNSNGGAGDGNNGGANNGGSETGDGGNTNQNQNQNQNGGGDGNQSTTSPNGVDLKNLSAEQLADVFENENLWKHPRFSNLAAQAQELKQLKDKQAQDEQKRLEDNKEFEKLAETRKSELDQANQTIQNMRIDQALTNKLVSEGVVDLEAALKLVDRDKLKIEDNGSVTGVDEALKSLKDGKAYLFNNSGDGNNQSLGSATNGNNGGNGTPAKFKRSQLRDPKFYQEHRDEIIAAQKAGLIEDDLSQ